MKHPDRDEWVPYVFGEARPEEAKRLSAHLASCAECAAEVTAWRRSLQTLNQWELPQPPRTAAIVAPVFRWAVAAAIVLAAGIALGRMTAPDASAVRAQVEASLKTAFAQQLAESEARLASRSQQESADLWSAFSEALANAREADREATLTLFEEHQGREEERYVGLRRDLETMASVADQEIRAANFKLTQLAGNMP